MQTISEPPTSQARRRATWSPRRQIAIEASATKATTSQLLKCAAMSHGLAVAIGVEIVAPHTAT